MHPSGVHFLWGGMGLEESDPPEGRVKKCPVDTFLARGRVPWLSGRSPQDCGAKAIGFRGKDEHPKGCFFLWGG